MKKNILKKNPFKKNLFMKNMFSKNIFKKKLFKKNSERKKIKGKNLLILLLILFAIGSVSSMAVVIAMEENQKAVLKSANNKNILELKDPESILEKEEKETLKSMLPAVPSRSNKDPSEHEQMVLNRKAIIDKINRGNIESIDELNKEIKSYKDSVVAFNDKHSYGTLPKGVEYKNKGDIQDFYYDNTNLDKFKVAFKDVKGIESITADDASHVANDVISLPGGFQLPSTIKR